jgi:hypothetical protein
MYHVGVDSLTITDVLSVPQKLYWKTIDDIGGLQSFGRSLSETLKIKVT